MNTATVLRSILLAASLSSLAMLGGCTEAASGLASQAPPCAQDGDCLEGQACVQGACAEEDAALDELDGGVDPLTDQDTSDTAVEDEEECLDRSCLDHCEPSCTAGEACREGVCVCIEGARRPCGLKVGECVYGAQTCTEGAWGPCEGGVQPTDELCDNLDNDCDGDVDEGVRRLFLRDLDNDGWGSADDTLEACELAEGYSERDGDCDDNNRAINPDAEEVCDGIDNDCDERVDGDALTAPVDCLSEGVCAGTEPTCLGEDGWRCLYPEAAYEADSETRCDGLDNDCDGDADEGLKGIWYQDADGDGFGDDDTLQELCEAPGEGFVQQGGDCEDNDRAINPDAEEVCDGIDNDCDQDIDADDPTLTAPPEETCPPDLGVCQGASAVCLGDEGWACPVTHEFYQPGGETLCDGLDNDCDGQVDEDISRPCGRDVGVCTSGVELCVGGRFGPCSGLEGIPPVDDESLVGLCDGLDNDCDGDADEGCECRDGQRVACGTDVGACTVGEQVCAGGRYGPCTGQGPRAEFCDALFVDHNCDGLDDIEAGLTTLVYDDLDGDGFGAGQPRHQCGPAREGQALRGGDCDDSDRAINPDAEEICDGVDNDCDELIDDDPLPTDLACPNEGVCRGTRPTCLGEAGWACVVLSPLYEEVETRCDGVDNDCDGQTDEGLLTEVYQDLDEDGFGAGDPDAICGDPPALTSLRDGDCDDNDRAINPDAQEVCDGIDNNCVDGVDEGEVCQPPTAICPDLEDALTESVVTLNGNGADPDGGPVRFRWRVAGAPEGSNAAPTPANEADSAFTPDVAGEYSLELCVTDDEGEEVCCQSPLSVAPRCVTPPAAASVTSCTQSWDRRPIVEFSPLPPGVVYHLTVEGRDEALTTITTTGQNYFRPAEPLGEGAAPPEGQSLTVIIESCREGDRTCCAPPERVTFQLIESCDTPVAPSPENLLISEYLVNGDGGACPGDGCEAGESIEITNLSHCPVTLEGHHFRYCNNANCSAYRTMNFGPEDIVPPRGVYVTIRNPGASTCELPFLTSDDPGLFGLKRSELVIQSNTTDRSGWFVNSGGGSLRIATGDFIDADSGETIALIDPYLGNQSNCQSVGFDAVNACGDVDAGSEPTTRLLPDQLGRLWHPCDAVVNPVPAGCIEAP